MNLHVMDIPRIAKACLGELATSHISGRDWPFALSDLAVEEDTI